MQKKILFVIPTMQQGGAERVVSIMANYWAQKGYGISVMSFDNQASYYPLLPVVNYYNLNSTVGRFGVFNFVVNNIKRTVNYLKLAKKIGPDVIISFTDNANVYCVLYNFFARRKLVITQRNNPDYLTLPSVIKKLPRLIYRYADVMVLQCAATKKIYERQRVKLPSKTEVIFNMIKTDHEEIGTYAERENIVLAVGRIENRQKQFDRLIDMFAATGNPGWQLHIAGDGPNLEDLKARIMKAGLQDTIILHGSVKNIMPLYSKAKIFALTSLFEGQPNALIEAMVNGCACISYDCPTGPAEIIDDKINGILVKLNDEAEFIKQLAGLMNDEAATKKFSAEAVKVKSIFDETKIMAQWENVIMQL